MLALTAAARRHRVTASTAASLVIGRRTAHKAELEMRTPEAVVPCLQEQEGEVAAAAVVARVEGATSAEKTGTGRKIARKAVRLAEEAEEVLQAVAARTTPASSAVKRATSPTPVRTTQDLLAARRLEAVAAAGVLVVAARRRAGAGSATNRLGRNVVVLFHLLFMSPRV